MARPSGTCNGQPCFTAGDKSAIDAEMTVLEAELEIVQAELAAINQQIAVLSMERMQANANSCP